MYIYSVSRSNFFILSDTNYVQYLWGISYFNKIVNGVPIIWPSHKWLPLNNSDLMSVPSFWKIENPYFFKRFTMHFFETRYQHDSSFA